MAQMLLSSPTRALMYTGLIDEVGEDPVNMRAIQSWLPVISSRIEQYLNRRLHIEQYTEYWDAREDMIEYTVTQGVPIISINSVHASAMGLYTGEEYLIINYYPSRFGTAISLSYPVSRWRKGLRAIYTGGYAYNGTQSTYAVGTITGTWTRDKYVTSGSTGAMGIIRSPMIVASPTLVIDTTKNYFSIEVLYGNFNVGDTLTEQDSEFSVGASDGSAVITASSEKVYSDITLAVNTVAGAWTVGKYVKGQTSGCIGTIVAVGTEYITCSWTYIGGTMGYFQVGETILEQDSSTAVGTSTGSAVITAFVQRAICEAYPEITTACEMELRYLIKHQWDLENTGTQKEMTSRRPDKWHYELQPEAIALLQPHTRLFI